MKKKIFILLGVFIGFLALFYGINISQKTSIYVSGSEIKNLINIWEDQTGRPPTNKEIDMIIKNLVNEEILYQEALKLGLNKNDKIIKRWLIQNLEFYKESENLNKVKEENIIEYYNENINSYVLNKRYSFKHIFFSDPKNNYENIKLILLGTENNSNNEIGEPFIHGDSFIEKDKAAIDSDFGSGFSENIINLEKNTWQGPFKSIYGDHLIYLFDVFPEEIISFEDAKKSVVVNYNDEIKSKVMNNYIYSIIDKYDVIIGEYKWILSNGISVKNV